jgi:hypothetical protein
LRAKNSPSFIAEELFNEAILSGENCIIESIRTVGEVEALKSKGNFELFSVDTDRKITLRQNSFERFRNRSYYIRGVFLLK